MIVSRDDADQSIRCSDERAMLNSSRPKRTFYCSVSGKSFDFEDSRRIDRENAKSTIGRVYIQYQTLNSSLRTREPWKIRGIKAFSSSTL